MPSGGVIIQTIFRYELQWAGRAGILEVLFSYFSVEKEELQLRGVERISVLGHVLLLLASFIAENALISHLTLP